MKYLVAAIVLSSVVVAHAAEKPLFSGPQVGERLPTLKTLGVYDDSFRKEHDPVAKADGKPLLLVFFHEKTRPAFNLTNAVMRFARTQSELQQSVIFLTDDPPGTEDWLKNVRKHFTKEMNVVISPDGAEGPGAYGLNRHAQVTVLVAKEGRVTANFALGQPSTNVDGPKILKALADALELEQVPDIADFSNQRYAGRDQRMMAKKSGQPAVNLRPLLAPMIQKTATPEQVKAAAKKLEERIAKDEAARNEVARIANTIVNAGKLSNYGTKPAQDVIAGWAKKYNPDGSARRQPQPE